MHMTREKLDFRLIGALGVAALALLLVLSASPAAGVTEQTYAEVTVPTYLSITLTNAPINFPSTNPGSTSNAQSGSGFPLTVTNDAISNTNANFSISGDQYFNGTTNPSNGFPITQMEYNTSLDGTWTSVTNSTTQFAGNIAPGYSVDVYFRVTIPSAQAADTYNTTVYITGDPA
jgi:hypothetical protein